MTYSMEFTQQEIQILMTALGELPLKVGGNVYSKIQMAVIEQDRKAAIPAEGLLTANAS